MAASNNVDKKKWQGPGGSDASSGSSKTKHVFVLTAILLALLGAVAALLFIPRTPNLPYFLTLSIREYENELWPTNPFAVQDGAILLKHFPKDKAKSAYNSQTKSRILRELEDLPGDQPLVVHLCAHAVTKDDEVYLIPGDAAPDRPGGWVRLTTILDLLAKNESSRKLLILDVMRLPPKTRLGILYQDVASQIESALQERSEKDSLPFFVLCASSGGQRSLSAHHLQQSVFAYYLHRGLNGAADGWGAKEKDDYVTVRELAVYVEKQVDFWAGANRNTRQIPRLFGDCNDFYLVRLDRNAKMEKTPKAKLRTYPDWLARGWKQRDFWKRNEFYLYAPRPFELMETVLLQTEKRWRDGIEPERVKEQLDRESRVLEKRVEYALEKKEYTAHSIALARAFLKARKEPTTFAQAEPMEKPTAKKKDEGNKKKKDTETDDKKAESEKKEPPKTPAMAMDPQKELESFVAKFERGEISLSGEKELKKAREEFAVFWKNVADVPLADSLHAVLQYAGAPLPLTQDRVHFIYELMQASKTRKSFSETDVIERLEQWRKQAVDIGWPWSNDAARHTVTTTLQSEKVITMLKRKPRALPWVRDAMSQADELRRKGDALLFSGQPPEPKKALDLLAQAGREYLRIEGNIKTIQDAYSEYGRALTELPGYVPAFIRFETLTQNEKDAWTNAVRQTLTLHVLLNKQNPADLEPISSRYFILRESLNRLATLFRRHIENALSGDRTTAEVVLNQHALLASSLLSSEERIKLWSITQTTGQKLHQNVLKEATSITKDTSASTLNSTSPSELSKRRWDQAYRQAWFEVQLLKLCGMNHEPLQKRLSKIQNVQKPQTWRAFAADLAVAWNETLPKRYVELKSDPFNSVRLSYFYSWYNAYREWDNDPFHWTHNPAASLHRQHQREFWSWLANRCRQEHQLTSDWRPTSSVYSNAATEYSR